LEILVQRRAVIGGTTWPRACIPGCSAAISGATVAARAGPAALRKPLHTFQRLRWLQLNLKIHRSGSFTEIHILLERVETKHVNGDAPGSRPH
jgi:hypothetical protein